MMADAVQEIKLEVFKSQSEIIRAQSVVIDGLLEKLLMHMDVEEICALPEIEMINDAERIKAETGL